MSVNQLGLRNISPYVVNQSDVTTLMLLKLISHFFEG